MSIAVFVKTPGYSPVNTRLAAVIGTEAAESLHLQCAAAVAAAARVSGEPVCWAVAEAEALGAPPWRHLPVLAQEPGGLGARMCGIYHQLLRGHGHAILLGADTPQIDARELTRAGEWLRRPGARLVIGEAADGGFWLFGGNRPVAARVWSSVEYGRADTARRFRAALGDRGDWLALARHTDLDTAADVAAVAAELEALADPLPQQRALASALRRLDPARDHAERAL